MTKEIEKLKYPIGKFKTSSTIDNLKIEKWIDTIEKFPENLKQLVENLDKNDLEKTYRPDGWTIRQIVHHCADSHMNSLIRFKLALTENKPTIKPYLENLWAELSDSKYFQIESSIKILEGLHKRWTNLLRSLSKTDLEKQFKHPETNEIISLKTNIGIYAWHCEHHLNHIKIAKEN